jgi:hypothetical protein
LGEDVWAPLRPLVGKWRKADSGIPGEGSGEREFRFVLNGRFLEERNHSVYPPQPKNPKGEVHDDLGFYSWDSARKTFVFRQFHVEGFVNQYVLESSEGGRFTWVTEHVENGPPGMRARLTFELVGDDEIRDRFELAMPGKDFVTYIEHRLARVG